MRGEVLQYDDGVGTGLISGDDGVRYNFRRAELQQLRPLVRGTRVDFVGVGEEATQIFVLDAATVGPVIESSNEDRSVWGYFSKCMSMSFRGEGRARRKEYWSFLLVQLIVFLLAAVLIGILSAMAGYASGAGAHMPGLIPLLVVGFLIFIPAGITVTIRRLHDIGLTGWFIFIALVPYLGSIILLVMSLIPSERRTNKHGLYPKPLD